MREAWLGTFPMGDRRSSAWARRLANDMDFTLNDYGINNPGGFVSLGARYLPKIDENAGFAPPFPAKIYV